MCFGFEQGCHNDYILVDVSTNLREQQRSSSQSVTSHSAQLHTTGEMGRKDAKKK